MRRLLKLSSIILLIGLISSCQNSSPPSEAEESAASVPNSSTQKEDHPKQEEARPVDLNKPVATFSQKDTEDELNDNRYEVNLYPTEDTVKFRLKMQYGNNKAEDTVEFPPSRFYDRIELRKGDAQGIVILGFIGLNGSFNDMKQISFAGNQIGIKTLNTYQVTENAQ